MQHTTLAGLPVTRLGFGLAAAGRPGYINLGHAADLNHDYAVEAMQANAAALLDRAWQAGIRYYDTARSYGRGEEFLAHWLQERAFPTEQVAVGSKWGYTYTANWQIQARDHEIKEHSLAQLERQWQESQALLGPYLDLYQIHSATLESGVLENSAVLERLAHLKAGGTRIGLSLSGAQQAETLRRALAITIDGVRLFDTVQASWNLLERTPGPALAEAHATGMGVIIKEALANGRLTERNTDPAFASQRALLEQQAARLGTTLDALALAAALAQPWVDVVLLGAASLPTLESNLHATAVVFDAEAEEALAPLATDAETYWAARKQMPWN